MGPQVIIVINIPYKLCRFFLPSSSILSLSSFSWFLNNMSIYTHKNNMEWTDQAPNLMLEALDLMSQALRSSLVPKPIFGTWYTSP